MGSYGNYNNASGSGNWGPTGVIYQWSSWNGTHLTCLPVYSPTNQRSINLSLNSNGSISSTTYGLAIGMYTTSQNYLGAGAWAFGTNYPTYKVCNIGSVYNKDNTENNIGLPNENRFQYIYGNGNKLYTCIPCYSYPNNGYTYYTPSLDSSGKAYSITQSTWYYYPV